MHRLRRYGDNSFGNVVRKDNLKLGKEFIIVKEMFYNLLVEKYKIDYPISRISLEPPATQSSESNLALEINMPKIRILQVPYTEDSRSDYLYLQISELYCKTIAYIDSYKAVDMTITIGYLRTRLCISKKQGLKLWKVAEKGFNYVSNYKHFNKQIAENKEFNGEAIEIDCDSKTKIRFKPNNILLIYDENGKFSV